MDVIEEGEQSGKRWRLRCHYLSCSCMCLNVVVTIKDLSQSNYLNDGACTAVWYRYQKDCTTATIFLVSLAKTQFAENLYLACCNYLVLFELDFADSLS